MRGEVLCLLYVFNNELVQPFVPDCAVVALNVGVLLRLPGLDVLDGNALFLSPFQQLATDIFWAIINPNYSWFSTLLDDPVQAADDPFGRERKVDLDTEPLAVEVVQHV